MIKKFFQDSKKYYVYSLTATKAALKAEVANSYLNWVWWILEPLCFTVIYYLIFGVFFHMKEDFLVPFLLIGIATWTFFSNCCNNSVNIMRNNKSVVSRVYVPKYVLLYVRLGVNGFKMFVSYGIAVVAMIVYGVPLSWNVFYVIPVLLILFLFTFGLSCFLLHFGVFVADLGNIVRIVLRMMFYLTGVFYTVAKRVPSPYGKILSGVNPIAYCINQLRNAALYRTAPHIRVLAGWLVISLVLCFFGVMLIYKNENTYVKSI